MSMRRVYEDVLTDAIYNPVKKLAQKIDQYSRDITPLNISENCFFGQMSRENISRIFSPQ